MLQFLLRISRQHTYISCFTLSPTKTVLRNFHKVELPIQTHHIQKCFVFKTGTNSVYRNNCDKEFSKLNTMSRRSSSPEILEVIEVKKSPKEDDSQSSDTSSKRRRDSTDQDPKDGGCETDASSSAVVPKKLKASTKKSPVLVDLTTDNPKSDSDDIEVILPPQPSMLISYTQGLYNIRSPIARRQWRNTRLGARVKCEGMRPNAITVTVMSYNVLSQELLVQHPYLYYNHNPQALPWPTRHAKLITEIRMHLSDVCGYEGIYKQRTGDKIDGCALFWQHRKFKLLEQASVEFYQPGVHLLNRDNIAIVARLAVKGSEDQIVVATTHLLYNPRRYDVRLAQTQLLLAELDRLSHAGNNVARFPVILTGDFNLTPHTSVYQLLTRGQFQQPEEGRVVLPMDLGITDCCRHYSLLQHRESSKYVSRTSEIITGEMSQLQLYHSERTQAEQQATQEQWIQGRQLFGSGTLSHVLLLQSAYEHPRDIEQERQEATTHQNDWVTVDYIFYSNNQSDVPQNRRKLRLLSRWSLPIVADCIRMGPIPNLDAPSDHLPLVACFLLS